MKNPGGGKNANIKNYKAIKYYYQHIFHTICVKGDICRQSVHRPRITQRRDWSARNLHSEHCGCVALGSHQVPPCRSFHQLQKPMIHLLATAGFAEVPLTEICYACSLYFAFFLCPLVLERTAVKSLQGTDILEGKQTAAGT